MEARLDADIDMEELLEVTVSRYESEVLEPFDKLVGLFQQPTVLDMLKERPKLVAGVNHYQAKMKGLDETIEESRKAKDKAKGAKAAEAAQSKLDSNKVKYDAEVEKLKHLTHQLTSSFHQIEATCVVDASAASAAAVAIKVELARFVGASAKDIQAHRLVSGGGGGGRESISGGGGARRARKRGKAGYGGDGSKRGSTYVGTRKHRRGLVCFFACNTSMYRPAHARVPGTTPTGRAGRCSCARASGPTGSP
jgi:hypothetical protein